MAAMSKAGTSVVLLASTCSSKRMRDALLEGFIHSQTQLDNALEQQLYVNYTLFRSGGHLHQDCRRHAP